MPELPVVALAQAGMSPIELGVLKAEFQRRGEAQGFTPGQQDMMVQFLETTDLQEWLEVQRHIFAGRFFQTDPAQAKLDQELFAIGGSVVVTDLSPNTAKASQQIIPSGASQLGGYAFTEATGKAGAKIVLYDGSSGQKKELFPITLKANESTREVFLYNNEGPKGLPLTNAGLYLEVVEGEVEGMVIWG
jgi:hypothetical protein